MNRSLVTLSDISDKGLGFLGLSLTACWNQDRCCWRSDCWFAWAAGAAGAWWACVSKKKSRSFRSGGRWRILIWQETERNWAPLWQFHATSGKEIDFFCHSIIWQSNRMSTISRCISSSKMPISIAKLEVAGGWYHPPLQSDFIVDSCEVLIKEQAELGPMQAGLSRGAITCHHHHFPPYPIIHHWWIFAESRFCCN